MMRQWICDRKIPYSEDVLKFRVLAPDMAHAATIAEALAYATAWHRGNVPCQRPTKKCKAPEPEKWALGATGKNGLTSLRKAKLPV